MRYLPIRVGKARAGFTLVELAVVLVVIALIAGGILVGKDLLAAAKIRAWASEIQQLETAIRTFRLKYNALPGDMKNAATFGLGLNGDGDYVIGYYRAQGEDNAKFWQHLSKAGLIKGEYSGIITGDCHTCLVVGQNTPSNAYNHRMSYMVHYTDGGAGARLLDGRLPAKDRVINIWPRPSGNFGAHENEGQIPVLDVERLDIKIDNGMPLTGKILGYKRNSNTCTPVSPSTAPDFNAVTYRRATGSDNTCYVIYDIIN